MSIVIVFGLIIGFIIRAIINALKAEKKRETKSKENMKGQINALFLKTLKGHVEREEYLKNFYDKHFGVEKKSRYKGKEEGIDEHHK